MNIYEPRQVSRKAGNGEVMPKDMNSRAIRGTDHRETANDYRGTLFDLGRFRVAVCRDDLQWLFQRRRPGFAGVGTAWDTLGYCVTRKTLMRLHRSHTGSDASEIAALPERFKRRDAE